MKDVTEYANYHWECLADQVVDPDYPDVDMCMWGKVDDA